MNMTNAILFIGGVTTGVQTDQSDLRLKDDMINFSKYIVAVSILVAEVAGKVMGYGFFETAKSIVAPTFTGAIAGACGSIIGRIFSKGGEDSIFLDIKLALVRSVTFGSAQVLFSAALLRQ